MTITNLKPQLWRPALFLAALLGGHANAMNVVGEAYDVDNGELRYREIHQCSIDGDRCVVEYEDPTGELIARKVVDYQTSLHSPSLEVQDLRQGTTISVAGDSSEEVVIDAGFDHYVRLRWDDLLSGTTVRFPFLVVGREKPLKMTASKMEPEACPVQRVCFRVALDNWLLGKVLTPIRLEYDGDSRRLLQFKGLSNIRDVDGKSQMVRIDYRYPESLAEERTS